ncbi:MAG: putative hydroxymethylpyrimidine transporter CytX [Sulfolobales archaeon]|nr:putative hydroxymethylpyrimidine transporter CytX [Sulfolobales archaeon]MCX8198786.1 putative hydroxymethylpyrimidine transporter CytX [Sulfolobales archaeon]MDW8169859.1 putative hydroxymethylpyrimidine transporter CytX [Desulfurococcaceae archaeon]
MEYGYDVKPIPLKDRMYNFLDVYNIWFGAGISIAEFWAGAVLIYPLGLDFPTALLAIIIGHLIGNALLSAVGLMGFTSGVPTMVLTRRPLGVKGSYLASLLNYLQLIGWTAVMLIVGALAMNKVSSAIVKADLYYLWIITLGAIVALWSLSGPEKWRSLEKLSALALSLLSIWLVVVIATNYDLGSIGYLPTTLNAKFWIGVDLVVAMPISWAPLIADYTRFSKSGRSAFLGSYLGYFISSSLFYALGALSNFIAGELDPIGIVAFYGLGIPALIIIVLSTVTTTFLDVYSAAITVKNVLSKASVKRQIVLASVLGTLLAIVFPVHQYEWFLLIIGGAFTSLTGIMVADFMLDKVKYKNSFYSCEQISIPTIAIWFTGFLLYMLLAASSLIPGLTIPVFSELGSTLGSSIATVIAVMSLYVTYRKLWGDRK